MYEKIDDKLFYNKKIKDLYFSDDFQLLVFIFNDNTKFAFFDNNGQCCEKRYMSTDDNLKDFISSIYMGYDQKEVKRIGDEIDNIVECSFLEIKTSFGVLLIKNYNEHNGYYGDITISTVVPKKEDLR